MHARVGLALAVLATNDVHGLMPSTLSKNNGDPLFTRRSPREATAHRWTMSTTVPKLNVLRAVRQEPPKSYFGVTVTGAVAFATLFPGVTQLLLPGKWISAALGAAMFGAACTLSLRDVTSAFARPKALIGGVCAQFLIMPTLAALCSRFNAMPALRDGVVLVGCCPGGAASNVVALLANADVALSIAMTACSTLSAGLFTPKLFQLVAGDLGATNIDPSRFYGPLLTALILPTCVGILWNERGPSQAKAVVKKISPPISSVIIGLIVAKIVADVRIIAAGIISVRVFLPLLFSVLTVHIAGFSLGYLLSTTVLRLGSRQSRAISIEVGMQNSALAAVLATAGLGAGASQLDLALAALPGATSACTHALLGGLFATYWRRKDLLGGSS